MPAMFEMTLPSETLSQDELHQITGSKNKRDVAHWLDQNGWIYAKTKAGEPVVGRMYARLRMAGINPKEVVAANAGWQPDFSALGG